MLTCTAASGASRQSHRARSLSHEPYSRSFVGCAQQEWIWLCRFAKLRSTCRIRSALLAFSFPALGYVPRVGERANYHSCWIVNNGKGELNVEG